MGSPPPPTGVSGPAFLLLFLTILLPSPAAPTSAFTCPFTIMANKSINLNEQDEMRRRDVTAEELEEEMASLVWCLPKTYIVERPPFMGEEFPKFRIA